MASTKDKAPDMESDAFKAEHPEFYQSPPWLEKPALTGDHTVYLPPVAPANAEQPAVYEAGTRVDEYVDPVVGEILFSEAEAAQAKAAEQAASKE
jgi:hypothetical protein